MRRSAHSSPFGEFGTRFKVHKAWQVQWLQNPALDERDVWPVGIATPLADIAVPHAGDQEDVSVRARLVSVVDALEGERGARAYATVEQDRYLVLRRSEGDVLAQMPLCSLDLVDIGERRVVIVPHLEPAELDLDGLGLLQVEDEEGFWSMIPSQRATYRNVQGAKEQSARARPIARHLPRPAESSRRRLPPIPEIPRAEASAPDSSAAASSSSQVHILQQPASRNIASGRNQA